MSWKVDLHDCYSNGRLIEGNIRNLIDEALDCKAKKIEIITGKGSGALKKSVLRFLEKQYKGKYHRIEKDDKNWGRIFVHFRY